MKEIMQAYRRLLAVVPLGSLRTRKEYERAVEMLDAILDEIGEDEKHPMAELADAISVCVERYENEHMALPAGKPSEVLTFLLREHELRQNDMPAIGTPGSGVRDLTGKREPNTRQIRKLAKRFGVSPAVFV